MLVLSRKKNQRVFLNDGQIEICVVEIRGDKVRLGFAAPREVGITRDDAISRGDNRGQSR